MANVLVLNNRYLGKGDDALGEKLMGGFLRKIWSQETKPRTIIFYNSAVLLLAEGSSTLDALNGLYEAGVDLIACGTCCSFFDISNKLAVGRISDMTEIASLITTSDSVVTV